MPVNAFTNEMEATYEEKMACVDGDTMFEFFGQSAQSPFGDNAEAKTQSIC